MIDNEIANTPPVIDLDADNSSTTGYNFETSYALGASAVSIGDVDVSIADDGTTISGATITLTNAQTGDLLFAGDLPAGITVDGASTSSNIILTGTATLAEYEAAIEAINFYNGTGSSTADRTVTVVVNDGTYDSNTATTTIHVASNALSVSAPETVEEGKSAVFIFELAEARGTATEISLSFSGTATEDTDGTSGDYDYNGTVYQYESSPGVWEDVVGNSITIAAGETSIAVKIKTHDDGLSDDGETLILTGTITSTPNTDMANTTASAGTVITEFPSIWVSAPNSVVEGEAGIFEVGFSSATAADTDVVISLSGEATSADYNAVIEVSYDEGATWTETISNGDTITIPAGTGTAWIRVTTIDDGSGEGDESLVLTATVPATETHISPYGSTASDDTVIVEPLALSVTEAGDDPLLVSASTSVTTTLESGYTYVFNGNGSNGTVTDNGDGTLTYTPNTDFSGTDSFRFIKIDTTTGEQTEGVANVTVAANADTPDVTLSVNNMTTNTTTLTLLNETFDAIGSWMYGAGSGGSAYTSGTAYTLSTPTTTVISSGEANLNSKQFLTYSLSSPLDADTYDLAWVLSSVNTTAATYGIYFVNINSTTGVITTVSTFTNSGGSWSATLNAGNTANAILIANLQTTGNSHLYIDSTALSHDTASITYDVNISYDVTDTDSTATEYEFIQDTITLTGVPATATFNNGVTNSGTGTVTLTQAQAVGLTITVSDTVASTGFDLYATVTSEENSNGSTAQNTATVHVQSSDLYPIIGDNNLIFANEAGFTGTITQMLETTYGDGTNTFSWDQLTSSIPEIYADGQLVTITFVDDDGSGNATMTGTINGGATQVFQLTVTIADGNSTNVVYTQNGDLLGVKETFDGGIVLPGGGNADAVLLQFNDSNGNFSGVDALVTAHNLIDDTAAEIADSNAEHTVNTNNFYIGVDSNNMNAGDQLVFDFATTNGGAHENDVASVDIALFNFGSEKSGDELFITVITASGSEVIKLLGDPNLTEQHYTVQSSSGEAILGIEFLAGNESSFKLGIEGVSTINYNVDFDMALDYTITDQDGDSDGGTLYISMDGDETVVFDASKNEIDAGNEQNGGNATDDTLVFNSGDSIDFSTLDTIIKNFEVIDLTNDADTGTTGAHSLTNLTLQDVFEMTDSNNTLTIHGDSGDTVTLSTSAGWTLSSSSGGINTYTGTYSGNSITLDIDTAINQSILP